ncbi:MAG: hypothetical protein H2049_07560 [Porphyrobacter sp.]|nr:hypothetical protein [Porphyrobacter sp.]
MKQAALVMATGAALMLAACGSETSGEFETADGKNAEYTIDKESGETSMTIEGEDGEASLRAGVNVPVSLPAGFTLFPGTKVVNNAVVNQPDGQGTMITFESDAPADKIVAHYRDAAKAAGFDIQLEMNTNGTQMVAGERKADSATVSVTATPGDGQDGGGSVTTGQIIIATKKGG